MGVYVYLANDVLDLGDDVVDPADHDELVVGAGRHAEDRLATPLGHGLPEEPRRLVVIPREVGGGHCGSKGHLIRSDRFQIYTVK